MNPININCCDLSELQSLQREIGDRIYELETDMEPFNKALKDFDKKWEKKIIVLGIVPPEYKKELGDLWDVFFAVSHDEHDEMHHIESIEYRNKSKKDCGYIYVIYILKNVHKIGMTTREPKERIIKELQKKQIDFPIKIKYLIPVENHLRETESGLKDIFQGQRIYGEAYHLNPKIDYPKIENFIKGLPK